MVGERLCAACARQAAAGCTCGVLPRRPMIIRNAAGARALACIWLALLVSQVGCQGSTGSSAGSGTGTGGTSGAGTTGYGTGGAATGAAGTAGTPGTADPSAPASMDPLVKVAAAACAERGPEYIFNVAALACARCPLDQVPNVDGNECVCPPTSRSAGLAGPLVCEDCSSKKLAVSIDGMSCMACAGRVRPWFFQTLLAFACCFALRKEHGWSRVSLCENAHAEREHASRDVSMAPVYAYACLGFSVFHGACRAVVLMRFRAPPSNLSVREPPRHLSAREPPQL